MGQLANAPAQAVNLATDFCPRRNKKQHVLLLWIGTTCGVASSTHGPPVGRGPWERVGGSQLGDRKGGAARRCGAREVGGRRGQRPRQHGRRDPLLLTERS